MGNLKRKETLDLSGGVQTKVLPNLTKRNQVIHALNAEFTSKIGAATGRMGSAVVSTVNAGKRVQNIMKWLKSDGSKKYFANINVGTNNTVKIATSMAGTWVDSLTGMSSLTDIFSDNFADKLMIFNGIASPRQYDGSNWSVITGAPIEGKFPVVYQQRMRVLTEKGYLWSSDVINDTGTDFTTTEWLNRGINPNDGQKCKMMVRHRNKVIIFKTSSIYKFDGTNEPEANINIGTHSGKSVVILGELYFHSPALGICLLGAGNPVPISLSVQKFLGGMDTANWENVAAGRDLQNLYFWIGNVTINDPMEHDYGRTYSNVVLVYNVFSQSFTVYNNWDARVWFFDDETGETFFGTSAGVIAKINTGYADVGSATTPISFEIIFTPEDYGYAEKDKSIDLIEVIGKYDSNVLIAGSYEDMKIEDKLNTPQSAAPITCKQLWVGVSEEYSAKPPRVEGLILDNANVEDNAN